MQGYIEVVVLIPAPNPLNTNCCLEPLLREIDMYGSLKRGDKEQRKEYIERVHTTKRYHVICVTRVLPLDANDDEVEIGNAVRRNEWTGADRLPC